MTKPLAFLFLAVFGLALTNLHGQSVANLPTTQQLGQMLEDQKFADIVRDAQRIVRAKPDPAAAAANPNYRYDVLMLKGEAHIQLKQQQPAQQAFNDATKETTEPARAGLAKGMMTLMQRSRNFTFTPKAGIPGEKPQPINIIDPTDRKAALAAIFEEQWKPTQTKVDAMKKRGQLPPILQAIQLAGEMRGLEVAATGKDDQTSTALADLTEGAGKLMGDFVDQSTKRVDEIDKAAHPAVGYVRIEAERPGLTGMQINELKEIISTCQQLTPAADEVAAAVGPKGGSFKQIASRSELLGKRAQQVLDADYGGQQQTYPTDNGPVQRGAAPRGGGYGQ